MSFGLVVGGDDARVMITVTGVTNVTLRSSLLLRHHQRRAQTTHLVSFGRLVRVFFEIREFLIALTSVFKGYFPRDDVPGGIGPK